MNAVEFRRIETDIGKQERAARRIPRPLGAIFLEMRNEIRILLILLISINICACKEEDNLEDLSYDKKLIENIAFGNREFAETFSDTSQINETKFWIHHARKDTIDEELGLKGTLFIWGAETTGYPFHRILHYKRVNDEKEYAIPFFDEECFRCGIWPFKCEEEGYEKWIEHCQYKISIDDQLNYLGMELGLNNDSVKVDKFVQFTFGEMLRYPKIELGDTTKYKNEVNDWTNHCNCCEDSVWENLREIFRNIYRGKSIYYEADQIGGFWEITLNKGPRGIWQIEIQYINEECAYTIRF
ncbi:MAG: hypothetical protein J7F05_07810 [Trichodesmium erythraeum GBRTRLIN201]|nr:hypothetical protein [Trichodesmium erythraeum GBRTRLIN201]